MATIATSPSLRAGDNLSRDEFIAIWEQLPDIKFAELIGGIVIMPSPLSKQHGRGDRRISGWLAVYEAHTPGCEGGVNVTSFIGNDCPQPDNYLAIDAECGGKSWGDRYVEGAPELIAETAETSASIDLHQKYDSYEQAGVQEYLVLLLRNQEIHWHRLVKGHYKKLTPDAQGILRSRVFPGLWLDTQAFFKGDMARVLATLQQGLESAEHARFVADLEKRKRKNSKR